MGGSGWRICVVGGAGGSLRSGKRSGANSPESTHDTTVRDATKRSDANA